MTETPKERIERLHAELVEHPHSMCDDAMWHLRADALRDEALRLIEHNDLLGKALNKTTTPLQEIVSELDEFSAGTWGQNIGEATKLCVQRLQQENKRLKEEVAQYRDAARAAVRVLNEVSPLVKARLVEEP